MTDATDASRWFLTRAVDERAKLNLFCFPYAGGGAQVFYRWHRAFPPSSGIQLYPVQYPGRGARMRERPFTDCAPLVEALERVVVPLTEKPFAFFGHSMGAVVAFELARRLRARHGREPSHMFISGRQAPQLPSRERPTYDLPEQEFVAELRRLNGTPPEALEHPELMEMLLPIIRADFQLAETYVCTEGPRLDCPFSIFGGVGDEDVTREDLAGWCEQTNGPCSVTLFEGDHFFLQTAEESLLRAVGRTLSSYVR